MSFILDALKKSENERQRQVGPSLADVPVRRARADRPWWAVAVAGLLVVNLGVLLIVLTRDGSEAESQTPAPQPAAVATQPGVTQQQSYSQQSAAAMQAPAHTNPAVHSLAEAAGTDPMMASDAPYDSSVAAAAAVPEGPPVVRPITPPTVAPMSSEPTFAARARNGAGGSEEMLPTHGSLIASGTNLPEMRLDIHVYSANPKERFVFINMHKYGEGQASTEGPLVERITPDGAILNQNGTRFLLPRQ
jgi:general secretion pathway protein B